ncbi:MAG: copper chaperone PCu(A)C [Pseudomonadota bacterium]
MKFSIPLGLFLFLQATAIHAALECREAWLREPPPNASVLAGYAKLINTGTSPLIINAINVAHFERAEIHRTEISGGMTRMVSVEHLTIAPDTPAVLEPGGMHLMLFHPRRTLRAGEKSTWYFTTNQGPQRCTAMIEK